MESGTIASWNKNEGETFIAGDSLCTVETDKATVDFEAQDDGVIAKILAMAGPAEIQCGNPILITVDDTADVPAFANYVVKPTSSSSSAPPPAAAAAAPPPATPPPALAKPTPAAPTPPPPAPPVPVASSSTVSKSRVVASPLAHMLAKDMGHDISSILGTGPGGRVIAADVKEFIPTTTTAASAAAVIVAPTTVATTTPAPAQVAMATAAHLPPMPGVGYTDYPLSISAQEMAAALTHSKQNVPHYYLTVDISMDALLELRSSLNKSHLDDSDSKIGTYDLLIKAAAAAMKTCPSANASWMDSVVRVYDSVDINIVVGNGNALYTPVLRNVGGRGVASIGAHVQKFITAATNDGEEPPMMLGEEFGSMGTFTMMNLGMYGIKSCAPIIREPQACALALGAMENRIVPNDGEEGEEIYKTSVVLTATLSCDHRVVDGAVGAQWLSAFKSHVEHPNTLLL
jgi:pyruvate dehydrogenase E2 component (dihydrolipoamide acetyltransferase)